ncbi:hypothetical protein ABB37_03200 [Leptomonas pyrrhocoris]|uniref:Uncharacterized protein n=1 Tax=Leptomonas pyrrhocoris TaxID=157538 RepID=A0A0M9G4E6_LEPPY|nr:hypothetical protein ABB37_03200 [Leptomonas pyrrhocoris]XP_015660466.1 hypothetical protein ABB37_03200 [Leptomonas pyrrhocoris]KPA82026.1 hypothetical protein ABB37_03200 [Leptomonas pyrrhocoris]KPA82027.1 hypothetical protein ABB37_03200 [Leptomonas pyrrhocoris]|eukprot:XP_015660465.1 hypothetical protein ABB37_03200 [Leptomonas pyrrhocoris]
MSLSVSRRWWVSLALAVLLCGCWVSCTLALTSTNPHTDANHEVEKAEEPIQVFMCADSGDYSGAHELGILQNSMEDAEVLKLAHCQSAQLGYIRHADGHAIRSLIVTTGIGYISATLCTSSVLRFRHARHVEYKSIVFIGTSGFSPMVGGWDPRNTTAFAAFVERENAAMRQGEPDTEVNADAAPPALFKTLKEVQEAEAEAARRLQSSVDAGEKFPLPSPSQLNFEHAKAGVQLEQDGCAPRLVGAATPLAIGSVCVTSAAFFMESGSCTERTRHTQCSRPHCSGFEIRYMREPNMYFTKNNFAEAIKAASADRAWPAMPPLVEAGLQRFWAANEAIEAAGRVSPAKPSFVTCAESTVNAINVGAERDFLCREYTAHTLNSMYRQTAEPHRDADPVRAPLTVNDVVCVQAMEGVGFLRSMAADAAAVASIPVAVLRTASNYDMYPLKKHYVQPEVWRAAVTSRKVAVSPEVAQAIEAAAAGESTTSDIAAYTWQQNFEFMSAEEYEKFVVASFHYSVKTVTFVVSNFFFGGRAFE